MFASGTDVRKKERQIRIRFTIGFDTISTSPAASGWVGRDTMRRRVCQEIDLSQGLWQDRPACPRNRRSRLTVP